MSIDLGQILGASIIFFYLLAVSNYIVKFVNRHFKNVLKKNDTVYKLFNKKMRFIVKRHKIFGLITIFILLSHFYVQYTRYGLSISGSMAASLLILQVVLGIYGYKKKRKGRTWLYFHRLIAIILIVAILNHVL